MSSPPERPRDAAATELERAAEELRRAQAVLLQAGTMAHLGAWWIDVSNPDELDANPLRWSDEVYRIFGYEPGEVEVTNALFFSHVHPDDRERVSGAIRDALAERRTYTVEHRIATKAGEERVLLERAEARYGEDGRLVLLLGAVQDVTAQVNARQKLRDSEAQARAQLAEIEAMYATAPIGLCVFDRELRWVRLNDRIAEINGVPREAHIGKTPREIVPDVGAQAEDALRKILETGQPLLDFEMSGTTAAQPGVLRFWNERWAPVRDADGRIIGVSVAAEEITERKRAEQRIADLARFPEENPNPVVRLSRDLRMLYANAAARGTALDVEPGGPAPSELAEQARLAMEQGGPLRTEVVVGGAVFSLTVVPTREEVSVYAQDVTALRRVDEQLRQANHHKDEFIATLSHELRNPLAPIRNAAYVLERADPLGEEAQRARAVIRRQVEHLTRLVDDLLDVTRIAKGRIELRRSRVDLREVVLRAADDLGPVMEDRGLSFRTETPAHPVWAEVDPTRIRQVVGNLLHNAAKFTRAGGEVVLSLRTVDGDAAIGVRDSGVGIDPALLPHLFDKFVQGERTLARSEGGLGLGLALVKGIAELHGGSARAESAGVGHGAEFVVALPLAPSPALDAPKPTPRRPGARRILVVDDNADAAQSLADLLALLGHQVEVAGDGQTAIALVRRNPPDVVVCDIGLPGMSGYDVAQALRASEHGRDVQLVALSGYAQPEDVKRARDAGFDAHLAKPCDAHAIERLLR